MNISAGFYNFTRVSRNRESGLGYETDSGVHCYNSTTNGCVDQCYDICNGDYQSCLTCKGYVTCANRNLSQRNCSDNANSNLVWDDTKKWCDSTSDTCKNITKN